MTDFDDLLAANRNYADSTDLSGFDGIARAGVGLVTCMDSRIDPLRLLGLSHGDAKMFRNPGGRITEGALEALVLSVHLLNVDRILIMPHTRCAMASRTEAEFHQALDEKTGQDTTWQPINVITDQVASLRHDVMKVRSHPLIPDSVKIGGFIYDVDTGLLTQHA